MPDAVRYSPLRDFVTKKGGVRLSVNPRLRDRLIDMAVEEFPLDAPPERGAEVLAARMRIRCREQQSGSLLALALISILANLVARLVWEWWQSRYPHRVLMHGWQQRAKKNPDL